MLILFWTIDVRLRKQGISSFDRWIACSEYLAEGSASLARIITLSFGSHSSQTPWLHIVHYQWHFHTHTEQKGRPIYNLTFV
jgi:hypothetical protein